MKNNSKKNTQYHISKNKNNTSSIQQQVTPTIYFDESGNTGSNLLDPNQPVFTLASCVFSEHEAHELIKILRSNTPNEAHFKKLRRSKSGQDGIVRLMNSSILDIKNVKANIMFKKFMVTTKIVDTLIEPMMHLMHEDLYLNGRNIALSNMLYACLPHYYDADLVQTMYESFIIMIREQGQEHIDSFYSNVENMKESSNNEGIKSEIDIVLSSKNIINDILKSNKKSSLDPSIPALFAHCAQWGNSYPNGFHIVHDDSKSIEEQRMLFAQFMDWKQDDLEIGYDRRKFTLPLKGKSMKFANSRDHLQLQVSDIIASSISYWVSGLIRREKDDYLFLELNKINLDKYVGNNIICPSNAVTPEELDTVHDGGLNQADHTSLFLKRAVPNTKIMNSGDNNN